MPAVALVFGERRTPCASGREMCVQKFGNACQRKELEKWMARFESTFQIQRNQIFANDARIGLSHTRVRSVIVCVMFCLRHVDTEPGLFFFVCAYVVRITSMIFMRTICTGNLRERDRCNAVLCMVAFPVDLWTSTGRSCSATCRSSRSHSPSTGRGSSAASATSSSTTASLIWPRPSEILAQALAAPGWTTCASAGCASGGTAPTFSTPSSATVPRAMEARDARPVSLRPFC